MTGPRADTSKSDRALDLYKQGLGNWQIAARLGISPSMVSRLLRNAKREIEVERAGKLADILGANI